MTLPTGALDYELPKELIATAPVRPRDRSRLLVLHRHDGGLEHCHFSDLTLYIKPGDSLALNTTRVIKARLRGRKETGGAVEVLLLRPRSDGEWEALCRPAARLRSGTRILFNGATGVVIAEGDEGQRTIRFESPAGFDAFLEQEGHVPLPPYLNRDDGPEDVEQYQTVYARQSGAIAAPTAGLHFTPELLARCKEKGIGRVELLLHVGWGTFRPLVTATVEEHRLEPEWYEVSPAAQDAIATTQAAGGRIVAVGTTSVRVLETIARLNAPREENSGWADLLIVPPFDFKLVGGLVTNFHLPRTSLLALVAAFAGLEQTLNAYRVAIEARYRFYSYGDAMLIL